MRLTAWIFGTELFERIYAAYPGPEPEAYRAACAAVEPIMPAVREEIGFKRDGSHWSAR